MIIYVKFMVATILTHTILLYGYTYNNSQQLSIYVKYGLDYKYIKNWISKNNTIYFIYKNNRYILNSATEQLLINGSWVDICFDNIRDTIDLL